MSYTDTVNNVVYAYTAGDTESAYVTVSSTAIGNITILKDFTADGITYPVKYIEDDAFNGNILTSVTFSSDSQITTIGNNAFRNSGLSAINIPDSVTSIGEGSFAANKIVTFTGGKNLVTIGKSAFSSNKLASVTVPNNVTTISDNAFEFNSLNMLLFLGSDVETIGASAFQGNSLTKLFIPVSVNTLGKSAFRDNKLTEVYFFNNITVTTFGQNCFAGNNANITAYYLDGFVSTTLPSIFGTRKILNTLVQLLTPLVAASGVSIETLVNDSYTFEDLAAASKAAVDSYIVDGYTVASNLFGYFDNVSVPVPWQSYLPYFTVSVIHSIKTLLTITDFKTANADVQQVYNEFGFYALVRALYTVKEIIDGVDPDPSITAFKNASADKQQMLTQFGLQTLWDSRQYTVSDLKPYKVSGSLVTVTVAQWWALSSDTVHHRAKPTAQELSTGGYILQDLWTGISEVSTIRTGLTPSPQLSEFWALSPDSRPTVRQLNLGGYTVLQIFWNVIQDVATIINETTGLSSRPSVSAFDNLTNSSKPSIRQLYDGGYDLVSLLTVYNVSAIAAQVTNLSIHNFKLANASIQQVYNKYGLSAMIIEGYHVADIVSGVTTVENTTTPPTIDAFKAASAPIREIFTQFGYAAMIGAGYYVKDIVPLDNTITYSNFASVPTPLWNLMTYYDYGYLLTQGWTVGQIYALRNDDRVKTGNQNLTVQKFYDTHNAAIWQMLNVFSLATLTPIYPTTGELVDASQDSRVTVVGNQNLTIDKMKAANDELYQVMNYYSDLADLLQVDYLVADLITESNKTVNGNRIVTVTALQDLGNKLESFVTANAIIIDRASVSKLWELINNFPLSDLLGYYTVHKLNATNNSKVTIYTLKAADTTNLYIQDVYDEFELSAMIGALYTVKQIIDGVDPDPSITAFKNASADKQQMLTQFGLQALWNNGYTVQELKPYKVSGSLVTVTVTQWWALSPRPSAQQLYDGGYTVLQDLWDGISEVATIQAISPAFDVANFWALSSSSKPTVKQLYDGGYTDLQVFWDVIQDVATIRTGINPSVSGFDNLTNSRKPSIRQLYDGGYDLVSLLTVFTVTTIAAQVTELSIHDFKEVGASIQQVYNKYGLSAMILEGYHVAEIVTGVTTVENTTTSPTIDEFKAASAPIQEVYEQFTLSEMIGAGYYVKEIAVLINAPSYRDFSTVSGITAWNLMTYYLFSEHSTDLLSQFIVAVIKDASDNYPVVALQNKNLSASDFKNANAAIWQMLNVFSLATLTPLYPTTGELVDASQDSRVTVVGNQNLTIDKMKAANDELYQVMNYYGQNVDGLADLLQVDYPVADLVTASNSGLVTVTELQDLGNKLSSFVAANTIVITRTAPVSVSKLSNLVDYFELSDLLTPYSVHDLNATGNSRVTIDTLKAASAPVQDMLTEFGLQAMWTAGYTVGQLKAVKVSGSNVTVTVEQLLGLTSGKPSVQQLSTGGYTLQDLWTGIYAVTPDSEVATIYDGLTDKTNATVALFWGLSSLSRPTVQELKSSNKYGLQELWTGIYSLEPTTAVATIYDGLDDSPLVSQFWGLSPESRPTVQELKSSAKYGLQELWTGIYSLEPTTAVATIYDGLDDSPLVSQFWGLSPESRPTVQELYDSNKYNLQKLWNGIQNMTTIYNGISRYNGRYGSYPKPLIEDFYDLTDPPSIQQLYEVYSISDLWSVYAYVGTIYDGLTVKPTVADFYDAGASINNLSDRYNLQQIWDYFGDVAQIYDGLYYKPSVEDWWGLSSDTTIHRAKPTIQQLYAANIDGILIYGLQKIWDYFKNVAQIYVGLTNKSDATVELFWGLTSGKPTIQNLYDASYNGSSIYGLQDLWNGIFYVETTGALRIIYDGLSVNDRPIADAFYALTSGKPSVQQFYDVYGLSDVIRLGYTVDDVIKGVTPDPTIADFKAADANIQQVYDEFKQSKYGAHRLTAMIGEHYLVADIVAGVTATPALTIADFKDAGAPIQEVYDEFRQSKYGAHRLTAMIGASYTVEEIMVNGVTADPSLDITDFKAAGANIQQVFTQFGLSPMINTAVYYVKDIIADVTSPRTLVYSDFSSVSTPLWNLMTYFDYYYNLLTQEWTVLQVYTTSSDSRVKSGNQNLTASNFKDKNAIIWQMLDTFPLADLIHLYTTTELVDASKLKDGSNNYLVTNIAYNKNLSIEKMQTANDELYEMMNYYYLADLLQVDYPVADLVTASNSGLVTVTALQNLGAKLASFVTANAVIIDRAQVSKLWNLINYFGLSDLLTPYSVHELNATTNDTKVNPIRKVDITSLKAASAPVQDMLTEFGLQAMWNAGYMVSQLKAVKVSGSDVTVTVAQLWDLRDGKPTIQQLYEEYGLQDLWTGIYSLEPTTAVATIYDGLTNKLNATVFKFWALSPLSRPTVQELFDSNKFWLQDFWDGIHNVATIRDGLKTSDKPTAAQFWALTGGKPAVQDLYDVYGLTVLVVVGVTVQEILDGISPPPSLSDFKGADAPIWQLLNTFDGFSGFRMNAFIEAGYRVKELVDALNLKDDFNNYRVTNSTYNSFGGETDETTGVRTFGWDRFSFYSYTDFPEEAENVLCNVLSSNYYNKLGKFIKTNDRYYTVERFINASNAKDSNDNYKVTLVDNQQLNLKQDRFIKENLGGVTDLVLVSRVLRYRSLFTNFNLKEFVNAVTVSGTDDSSFIADTQNGVNVVMGTANYDYTPTSGYWSEWDSVHDWRVTVSQLKEADVSIYLMLNYYGNPENRDGSNNLRNFQIMWDAGYTISAVRLASTDDGSGNYKLLDQRGGKLSVYGFLNWLSSESKPTIRDLQNGGYGLQELTNGSDNLSPFLDPVTGYSPVPTVADFVALGRQPSIQRLYDAFGLQTLYNSIDTTTGYVILYNIRTDVRVPVTPGVTRELTVADFWALDINSAYVDVNIFDHNDTDGNPVYKKVRKYVGRPTVKDLNRLANYDLQQIWDGIGNVSDIYNGFESPSYASPTVAGFWGLSNPLLNHRAKPTIQQLYDAKAIDNTSIYTLQLLWNGIYSVEPLSAVATIYDGLNLSSDPLIVRRITVSEFWALNSGSRPTIQELVSSNKFGLQQLWDAINAVSSNAVATIYLGLTVKPTVAQWWSLDNNSSYVDDDVFDYNDVDGNPVYKKVRRYVGRPTAEQLVYANDSGIRIYNLQNLWDGIGSVAIIYDGYGSGSYPTIAQFNNLSANEITHRPRPTLRNYLDRYSVVQIFASGYTVTEILTVVKTGGDGAKTTAQVVGDLLAAGFKIRIPAPRITAASFSDSIGNLTVSQDTPDVTITQYLYSDSSDGGVTWSDYAVVMDNVNNNEPLLPSNGVLIVNSNSERNKLHSIRIKAEAYGIISNTSNTFKNVFF